MESKIMKRKFMFLFLGILIILSISCKKNTTSFDLSKSQIYVFGTLHANHLFMELEYSLSDLENVIHTIKPDLICFEMTPEALGKELEGYFPPENAVIINYAIKNNVKYVPVDWRNELSSKENENADMPNTVKDTSRKIQQKTEKIVVDYLSKNNWKGYFNFIHDNLDFRNVIKEQHDTKINMLGEEYDGYWLTRNEKIVDNVVKAIQQEKAKKVLITFGLHHKYIIEDYLREKYNVIAEQIPEYENSTTKESDDFVVKRWEENKEYLEKILEDENTSSSLKNRIISSSRLKELDMFIASKGISNRSIRNPN